MRYCASACFVMIFALLVSCSGGAFNNGEISRNTSQTAFGTSWNNHCAAYNFDPKDGNVTTATTLGEMYNGTNFAMDISALDFFISMDLGYQTGLKNGGPQALYIWYDDDHLLPPPSN